MSVVVLTGGVGGAKLVLGLIQTLPRGEVTAIVNTGDDFTHLGLAISPDIDTLLYTLAGKANAAQGWGGKGETWSFLAALRSLGGEDWFALGDGDLALHVLRTMRRAAGEPLSAITADFAWRWGIGAAILPMSDDSVGTIVETEEGPLAFQRYFVERRCEPAVRAIRFEGAETARPAPGVIEAIHAADAILIAPSNPFLSVDPLLAVPGLRSALGEARAPVVAVSPIIGGAAVKGPTAKLMRELGLEVSNASIVAHYHGLIDGLVIHSGDDAPESVELAHTDTMMRDEQDKIRVAEMALMLARSIASR